MTTKGIALGLVVAAALWYLATRPEAVAAEYVCPYCGETFDTIAELENHILLEHPESPSFICPYCGEAFFTQEELDSHIASEHPAAIGVEVISASVSPYIVETLQTYTVSLELNNKSSQAIPVQVSVTRVPRILIDQTYPTPDVWWGYAQRPGSVTWMTPHDQAAVIYEVVTIEDIDRMQIPIRILNPGVNAIDLTGYTTLEYGWDGSFPYPGRYWQPYSQWIPPVGFDLVVAITDPETGEEYDSAIFTHVFEIVNPVTSCSLVFTRRIDVATFYYVQCATQAPMFWITGQVQVHVTWLYDGEPVAYWPNGATTFIGAPGQEFGIYLQAPVNQVRFQVFAGSYKIHDEVQPW